MTVHANFKCRCGAINEEAHVMSVTEALVRVEVTCTCGNVYESVYLHMGGTITEGASLDAKKKTIYTSGLTGEMKR